MRDIFKEILKKIEKKPKGKVKVLFFLRYYKKIMETFLKRKITKEQLSDFAVRSFAIENDFSNELEKFDSRIRELRKAMDITHPNWTDEKRKEYIIELIKLADKIIEDHQL